MRALICGITGQDGSYLAKLLVDKGYEVIGTSRDAMIASLENLHSLGMEFPDFNGHLFRHAWQRPQIRLD